MDHEELNIARLWRNCLANKRLACQAAPVRPSDQKINMNLGVFVFGLILSGGRCSPLPKHRLARLSTAKN